MNRPKPERENAMHCPILPVPKPTDSAQVRLRWVQSEADRLGIDIKGELVNRWWG
jgi:hypothetical protein